MSKYNKDWRKQKETTLKHRASFNHVETKMDKLSADFRMLQRRVMKSELREKQIIILFKRIIDLAVKRQTKLTIEDIVSYMRGIVQDHKYLDDEEDLFDEIVQVPSHDGESIGVDAE